MNLTEQELKAIERDAETYSKNKMSGWGRIYSVSPKHYMRTGFIEGVKQERIKAKQLIKALEEIKSWADKGDASLPIYEIFGIAVKAINEYNKNS